MRRMRSDDVVVRVGAQLGLLFCLGYSVFSLSEMMFRNMRSVPIYAVTVVLLYALTTVRKGSPGAVRQRLNSALALLVKNARSDPCVFSSATKTQVALTCVNHDLFW